jgi:hypothetical protein
MRLKKDPPPPMSDKELQERRRLAELAAMMFDRSYRGSQESPYFQGMSPEEYDEELRGMPPEEFYKMVSRGIDNPQSFYDYVSQYSGLPDRAKAAMKSPTDVYSDLANRVIYSGAELLTTRGQGTAFDEAIELASLIKKYPDAVTSTRGGFEGTVDAVDVKSPSQTMTPIKRLGLPKADVGKSLRPIRKIKADRIVEEQPIMSDPAETARRAGFRGVQSQPVQIGVKRFFRRPDGTGYVKTEMFD